MPLPLDGIENKYSVRKSLPLGGGRFCLLDVELFGAVIGYSSLLLFGAL